MDYRGKRVRIIRNAGHMGELEDMEYMASAVGKTGIAQSVYADDRPSDDYLMTVEQDGRVIGVTADEIQPAEDCSCRFDPDGLCPIHGMNRP